MRLASTLLAIATLVPAAGVASAVAQMPACNGRYATVRVSDVKPGMMETFDKAVAAQKAWYAKMGTKDEITVLHVYDSKAKEYSKTEALTIHSEVPGDARPKEDDPGYAAFVSLYKSSSTIRTQFQTCMAK